MIRKGPEFAVEVAPQQVPANDIQISAFGLPHGPMAMPAQKLEREPGFLLRLLRFYGTAAIRK